MLRQGLFTNFALAIIVVATVTGCASAPTDTPRTESTVLTDTDDTRLANFSDHWLTDHPGQNGFYPLAKGIDAFGARLALIDAADRAVDVQYFLMKPDDAGMVFADRLLDAANRGVRVRFLIDDIFTTVKDRGFIAMNEHPNIEIRLFNPISRKGVYAVNYVGNFKLANRRMHNKSLTADNKLSIVGGRNIAEEYYQLDTTGEFIDFDTLAVGPIVNEVSAAFDLYWNHQLAIPMNAFYDDIDPDEIDEAREQLRKGMEESGSSIYAKATHTELMLSIINGDTEPYLAESRLIIDDPQKLLEKVSDEHKIVAQEIVKAFREAESEILIFTPYLIPGKRGIELIRELTAKGIKITILTNSLATNNHTPVHSAYASYRKRLLEAGVDLWEARGDAAKIVLEDGTTELDQLTLHTKGIIIDKRYTFVGSLNLDPRSIDINTEMGVMIDSTEMATRLEANARKHIPDIAYQLRLDEKNRIRWYATINGEQVVETKEPQTSWWMRFKAWFMKIAPEGQL